MSFGIDAYRSGLFDLRSRGLILAAVICVAGTSVHAENRIALVIGNSHYEQLGTLKNARADATSVADLLKGIGYKTTLVQEASEQGLRRAVRAFAAESVDATIAVVYYAGHGAQVNGENFLLPVDMDIPRQEGDIQLTGLKVDDLVNVLRSRVKVVFLDACRDNPALFRNLVRGRGSAPVGLAPARANLSPGAQGGGVFIAYATDSDSVALDGNGAHSPFAQALLEHLSEQRSLDDMFSIVTREVMKASNNMQRPYKYASLDEIVCIPAKCGKDFAAATQNQVATETEKGLTETDRSASKESAQTTANADLSSHRHDPLQLAAESKLDAEHPEWTLIDRATPENGGRRLWIKMSSVRRYDDRVTIEVKNDFASATDAFPNSEKLAPAYTEHVDVFDCQAAESRFANVETTVFNTSNKIIYKHVFGPAEAITITADIVPKTDLDLTRKALCDITIAPPLISRDELKQMAFAPLATAADGKSEFYYKKMAPTHANEGRAILVNVYNEDQGLGKLLPLFADPSEKILFRYVVSDTRFDCDDGSYTNVRFDVYDSAQNLVNVATPQGKLEITNETSPVANLRRLMCKRKGNESTGN